MGAILPCADFFVDFLTFSIDFFFLSLYSIYRLALNRKEC